MLLLVQTLAQVARQLGELGGRDGPGALRHELFVGALDHRVRVIEPGDVGGVADRVAHRLPALGEHRGDEVEEAVVVGDRVLGVAGTSPDDGALDGGERRGRGKDPVDGEQQHEYEPRVDERVGEPAGAGAAERDRDDIVLVNLSGRGDKDINTVADLEGMTL